MFEPKKNWGFGLDLDGASGINIIVIESFLESFHVFGRHRHQPVHNDIDRAAPNKMNLYKITYEE